MVFGQKFQEKKIEKMEESLRMSIDVGSILQGKVTGITNFGAFILLPEENSGLVHISEVSNEFIKDINDVLTVGDEVNVKVVSVAPDGKISLSIKQTQEVSNNAEVAKKKEFSKSANFRSGNGHNRSVKKEEQGFDALISSFLKTSEERLSLLRRNTESKRGGRGGRRS
jgi:S1 RNA binding domain protein